MLQDSFTNGIKHVLSELEAAETGDDVQNLAREFIQKICTEIQQLKANPEQQKTPLIVARIIEIIDKNYSDPTLCLAGIAEEIGLSSNYTGHVFKQHTQKSVAQYLLDVRMEKVAYYIQNTALPVSKFWRRSGWRRIIISIPDLKIILACRSENTDNSSGPKMSNQNPRFPQRDRGFFLYSRFIFLHCIQLFRSIPCIKLCLLLSDDLVNACGLQSLKELRNRCLRINRTGHQRFQHFCYN